MSEDDMRKLLLSLDPKIQYAMLREGSAQSIPANVTQALKLSYAHDGTKLDPGLQRLRDGYVMVFCVADEVAGGRDSSDDYFNKFLSEEAKRKKMSEKELRESLLMSAETVKGEKRFVKVSE